MKNIFNTVQLRKVATSRFDLSHDVKMSFQMGDLVPTCVMEAIPGDVFDISFQNMLRFAPMIAPVMHQVKVTTQYFFVPNRILWAEWENWITGNTEAIPPYIHTDEWIEGSLSDYVGVPPGTYAGEIEVSALPFAAIAKIWDEWYRDQNLQTAVFHPLIAGDNSVTYGAFASINPPLKRAWEHDYFTSALPFAQKGPEVNIPLVMEADIPVDFVPNGNPGVLKAVDGTSVGTGSVAQSSGPTPFAQSVHVSTQPAAYDPEGTLSVDVQGEAASINTLRRAFRLQEWLERNARGGTRYVESILAHFGVKSSDARLNRPEYIGSALQNMVISEVLATAQSADDSINVGTMAGHGISVGHGQSMKYKCEEHGWIIGLINVQPTTAYYQGLHKSLTRVDRLDYAWPTFANIGEQEIKNKELYLQSADREGTFGYIPRYAEYKFMNSRVAGDFRGTLDFWHFGRKFDTPPALNAAFIAADPALRPFAVTDAGEDHLYAHVLNNINVVRKLPRFGIPTI